MTVEQAFGQDSPSSVPRTETPPTNIAGILRRLGPGLIIAGSIVGSGELIATTKTGAEAGFALLWLILIGCVIKVFVQVEMGRYTVVSGRTTMDGLAEVPGPRLPGHGNWLIWYWGLVFIATIGQMGGIVGGVGQALQISFPLTEGGRAFNRQVEVETQYTVTAAELQLAEKLARQGDAASQTRVPRLKLEVERLGVTIVDLRLAAAREQLEARRRAGRDETGWKGGDALQRAHDIATSRAASMAKRPELVFAAESVPPLPVACQQALTNLGRRDSRDDEWWALVIAVITAGVLVIGRYGLIQSFSTVMVASFTFITVVNLAMLQSNDYWAVGVGDVLHGLSFKLPPPPPGATRSVAIATALATFGIIGVGANELLAYPYWCLEKGYARFTGPRDESPEWAQRARGWMRVMRWDAWCSMVVYTFATLAFYLLGAAILGRTGLNPAGDDMIRTLGVMYEPVFGTVARWIFLFGAFAVLYSTFFVATASLARVVPDALRVMGIGPRSPSGYRCWIRVFSGVLPFLCVTAYTALPAPERLVLLGGVMQGMMLPMLAAAALYFRFRRSDARVTPGGLWDVLLWVSAAGMLVTGVWTAWTKLGDLLLK